MKIPVEPYDSDYDEAYSQANCSTEVHIPGGVDQHVITLAKTTALMQAKHLELERQKNQKKHVTNNQPTFQHHVVEKLTKQLISLLRRAITSLLKGKPTLSKVPAINNTTASLLNSIREVMDAMLLKCERSLHLSRELIEQVIKATIITHILNTNTRVLILTRRGRARESIRDIELLEPYEYIEFPSK